MPTYESKRHTLDNRKYYFSCYYIDKYGTRKNICVKCIRGLENVKKKKDVLLKISFCIFSILNSIIVLTLITNILAVQFGLI